MGVGGAIGIRRVRGPDQSLISSSVAVGSASAATFAFPFASALTGMLRGNGVMLLVGRLGVELDRNVTAQI